jgi:thermitase
VVYPAGYQQVLGIGSTNNQDGRSTFSNYGSVVSLAAPGEAIVTTYPQNRYAAGWGTSFSAPFVAGGAALLVQLNGQITPSAAKQALSQAVAVGQGLGAGRLDLVRALQAVY